MSSQLIRLDSYELLVALAQPAIQVLRDKLIIIQMRITGVD